MLYILLNNTRNSYTLQKKNDNATWRTRCEFDSIRFYLYLKKIVLKMTKSVHSNHWPSFFLSSLFHLKCEYICAVNTLEGHTFVYVLRNKSVLCLYYRVYTDRYRSYLWSSKMPYSL